MCCLFGLIDYGHSFTGRQKAHILSVLSAECEARGTDATGIAYNGGGRLRIYKRPLPAHKMRFFLTDDVQTVMGHTRLTTQGSEKKNYNNHPFPGMAGRTPFALAHNGAICNDLALRRRMKFPRTDIETDSYIAVQLIEEERTLDFDSLRNMAEALEGSFTFTVLDGRDELYFVRGDNPMCLYQFPCTGLYLYASTKAILGRALKKMRISLEKPVEMELDCGDILKIDRAGEIDRDEFDPSRLYERQYSSFYSQPLTYPMGRVGDSYIAELKTVAGSFGYSAQAVDRMIARGFTPQEIEEFFYCGEL